MATTFVKEVLTAFEPPSSASDLSPLHLFLVLNLLIVSIILITVYWEKGASRVVLSAPESQIAASSGLHEVSQLSENEMLRPVEIYAKNNPASREEAQSRGQSSIIGESELDTARSPRKREDRKKEGEDENEEKDSCSTASFDRQNSAEKQCWTLEPERPLASTHFLHKKLAARAQTCKSPLKISRPSARKGETLDATWKAICDDKLRHSTPLRRHHVGGRETRKGEVSSRSRELPKSPLRQRHQMQSGSPSVQVRLREPSMTRDELHTRVESFISRFHEQIRIQRQQSSLGHQNLHHTS